MVEDRDQDDHFGPALKGFYFLFADECNDTLDSIELTSALAKAVKRYFVDNLHASVSVISIPFLMADAAVLNSRFDRILLAESIRARKYETRNEEPSEEEKEEVLRTTKIKYRAFLDTAEAADFRRDSVLSHLTQALRDEKFRRASEQLLREALAMIWSSFETLSSDLFRELVKSFCQCYFSCRSFCIRIQHAWENGRFFA